MGVAAFSRFTERGIARRAAERRAALLPHPSAMEAEIEPVEAAEPVSNVVRLVTPRDELRRIIDLVARMHGSTYELVQSRSRVSADVLGRQAAMCAIRQHSINKSCKMPMPQIGRLFEDRCHTCVNKAFNRRGFK